MTTIEKAQSASVFFFFLSSSRFHLSIHVRTIFTYVHLPPSFISIPSYLLRFLQFVNCNCNYSIRLFLGREAKEWRENGEIPSKVFERNFLSRRWKGRREMTQHTTMQATRETVSAAKLDSRWTAAWSNIVQWLSNELMHSPVHVPIMYDTIG